MIDPYSKFRKHVNKYSLVADGDRILLAVSSGKDSMAMLHMMLKLQGEIDFEIGVFHLNHMTRGADSDGDEAFVAETASRMGIFCRTLRMDINSLRPGGLSFEEHARKTRYRLLQQVSIEEGFSRIATAHNSDDNSETVLMRIFSGTGIRGLRGIPAVRDNIIRPMLCCSAGELYEYLKANGFSWREDYSNTSEVYLRNFLRNRIIPAVKGRFPEAPERINRLADLASESCTLIGDLLEKAYPGYTRETSSGTEICNDELLKNIPALKYIITGVLGEKYGVKVSVSVLEEIVKNYLNPGANKILYENGIVRIEKKYVEGKTQINIVQSVDDPEGTGEWSYTVNITKPCDLDIPEINYHFSIEKCSYDIFLESMADPSCVFISAGKKVETLTIRNRRDGDRIVMNFGTAKIKGLMIEKKLDSGMKKKVPIIVIDGKIVACLLGVAGPFHNRVSCNFSVRADSEKIFRINYSGMQ